jgi:anti-anti-sigma factor
MEAHLPLALVGDIDVANSTGIGRQLVAAAQKLQCDPIEIDCRALTFLDASGLAMLVRLREACRCDVVLHDVPSCCRRVIEITDLDEVFKLC